MNVYQACIILNHNSLIIHCCLRVSTTPNIAARFPGMFVEILKEFIRSAASDGRPVNVATKVPVYEESNVFVFALCLTWLYLLMSSVWTWKYKDPFPLISHSSFMTVVYREIVTLSASNESSSASESNLRIEMRKGTDGSLSSNEYRYVIQIPHTNYFVYLQSENWFIYSQIHHVHCSAGICVGK